MRGKFSAAIVAGLAAAFAAPLADADVMISTNPTQNMTCSAGVCSPTAADAVLNVADLVTMLVNGDVKVTTGSGATNIVVAAKLTWKSTSLFTLDAEQSIAVSQPVTAAKKGGLTILYNDGGSGGDLLFTGKGSVSFHNPNSKLTVNGIKYTLVYDIPTLAAEVAQNTTGNFALATDYDAVNDIYNSTPIITFDGNFEGLGHTISHLTAHNAGGLFGLNGGVLRDFALEHVSIRMGKQNQGGVLAGFNAGLIAHVRASGKIRGKERYLQFIGGLIGENSNGVTGGTIFASSANVSGTISGGLVGWNNGSIDQSFASGTVPAGGGLVGAFFAGTITNSYASGVVAEGVGGLISGGSLAVQSSYSTTQVGNGNGSGGFVGDVETNAAQNDYWDTDTSGQTQGCGEGSCAGITGLSDAQLKSGLPAGFDPKIWAIDPKINNGYPYLINNPPQQ